MKPNPLLSPKAFEREIDLNKEEFERGYLGDGAVELVFSARYCDLEKARRAVSKSN